MPQSASTRLALVGPTGTDALSIGDDQIRAIITQLEAVAAGYLVDVAANRPAVAAANKGYAFVATDTGILSWSTGSAWIDVNPKDAAAGTASLRTLGTGATQAAAGNHTHDTTYQPLDSDLTAIAALSTTSVGRSLLAAADAAALRTIIGAVIGTDVQAHDSDLDSIAALATTTFGRSLLTQANAAAAIATLGAAASDLSNVEGAWTGFAFSGVFGNFGGSERNAQYRKIGTTVQLRGLARVNSSSFAFPVTMGVMPSGYRPTAIDRFNCLSYNGSQIMTVSVYIDTSGNVILDGNASTISSNGGMTGATGNWVNLADIQFSTA